MEVAAMSSVPSKIFERTAAGQREALDDKLALGDPGRRMLLMVNGYTPLADLAARLPGVADIDTRVQALVDRGLIADVQAEPSDYASRWMDRRD